MPAAASNLDTILTAVAAAVRGVGLTLTNGVVPVVVRKLPKREETDPAEQITVSGDVDLDSMRPYAFGDIFRVEYRIQVTLITPNDNDAIKHLPDYLNFRQRLRQLFRRPPLTGATAVIGLRVEGGPFLPHDEIAKGYDLQALTVVATTIEP